MKRILFIFALLALGSLTGCRHERLAGNEGPQAVTVTIPVRTGAMSVVSRAADDEALHDVNFWLSDKNGDVVRHGYERTPMLRFECLPGAYRLRIAANIGRDLSAAPDPGGLSVACDATGEALPMAWEGDISIPAAGGTLPAVELVRRAAKVVYRIAARPADLELRSVQLRSIPLSAPLFGSDDAPSNAPADYTDGPLVALAEADAAGECYLLPNRQGVVSSITDQRDKNAASAPRCASYLMIRAVRGAKVLAYSVYLGENNTSDFNVRANTCYRMNISILGDDEVDTRVSSYTASVEDTFEQLAAAGYCHYIPIQRLTVKVTGGSRPPSLRGQIEVTEGDAAAFGFNGASGGAHDFAVAPGEKIKRFPIDYAPQVFTTENSRLCYRVRLTDEYGFSQQYDFTHDFADELAVYAPAGGAIRESGALYAKVQSAGEKTQTVLLCLGECRLRAMPEAGYAFGGWYADSEYTQRLSSEAEYRYRPAEKRAVLHAQFIPLDTPLDGKGTANCYIAPELNTWYSFDATVQGNGKATTGIVPEPLAGVEAKVIWETGTVRGAVVGQAEYRSGRIRFLTGRRRGNALVGLFDAAGACVWSWHIWAVDYTPEAAAQLYASGFVFMDRNLRALNADPADASARGLYYQWGRKDPFPYPAANGEYAARMTPVCSLDGYGFAVYSNTDKAGKDYPADYYTIAWATAHPTAFLVEAPDPAGSITGYLGSWCVTRNPNLWGNASNGEVESTLSRKSIYDPCPPGWRVPPKEAWETTAFRAASAEAGYGWNMYYAGTATAYYPSTGYMEGYGNIFNYYLLNSQPQAWTNTPAVAGRLGEQAYYLFIDRTGKAVVSNGGVLSASNPVRCIKE